MPHFGAVAHVHGVRQGGRKSLGAPRPGVVPVAWPRCPCRSTMSPGGQPCLAGYVRAGSQRPPDVSARIAARASPQPPRCARTAAASPSWMRYVPDLRRAAPPFPRPATTASQRNAGATKPKRTWELHWLVARCGRAASPPRHDRPARRGTRPRAPAPWRRCRSRWWRAPAPGAAGHPPWRGRSGSPARPGRSARWDAGQRTTSPPKVSAPSRYCATTTRSPRVMPPVAQVQVTLWRKLMSIQANSHVFSTRSGAPHTPWA